MKKVHLGTCGATLIHGDIALTAAHVSPNQCFWIVVVSFSVLSRLMIANTKVVSVSIEKDESSQLNHILSFSVSSLRSDLNEALVGAHVRSSTSDGAQYTTIAERVPHPNYDNRTEEYDFMLLKLGGWMQYPVVSLNANSYIPAAGETLTTMGFGDTSAGGSTSTTLLQVNLTSVANQICRQDYPEYIFYPTVMMCAASPGKDR